jgi:hypothetical protein
MTKKAWRLLLLTLTGLGVLVYTMDWYAKGNLSPMGWTGFALVLTAFLRWVILLVKDPA